MDEEALPDPGYALTHSLEDHQGPVSAVRFTASGDRVATSSADKTAKVWDASTGTCVLTLEGHSRGISDLCWDHTLHGRYLITASDDTTVGVWDVERGIPLRFLRGHTHYVMCVRLGPRDNLVASGSFDERVAMWDVRCGGQPIRTIPAHSDPVTAVDFSPDGRYLATSSYDGLVRVWQVATGRCVQTLAEAGSNAPVGCVRFAPAGQLLAAAQGGGLRLWDGMAGAGDATRPRLAFEGSGSDSFCAVAEFCLQHRGGGEGRAGHLVAAGGDDGRVRFWPLSQRHALLRGAGKGAEKGAARRPVYALSTRGEGAEGSPVLGLEFHGSGRMATCSKDGTAKLWALREELRQPL